MSSAAEPLLLHFSVFIGFGLVFNIAMAMRKKQAELMHKVIVLLTVNNIKTWTDENSEKAVQNRVIPIKMKKPQMI